MSAGNADDVSCTASDGHIRSIQCSEMWSRKGPGRGRAIREGLINQGCDMVLQSETSIIRVGHADHDCIWLARARSAQRSIQPGGAPGRGTWYSSHRISQARAARTSLEETYGTPCALLWLLILSLMAASCAGTAKHEAFKYHKKFDKMSAQFTTGSQNATQHSASACQLQDPFQSPAATASWRRRRGLQKP